MTSRSSLRRRAVHGAVGASVLAMVATAGGASAVPLDDAATLVEGAETDLESATEPVVGGVDDAVEPDVPVEEPEVEVPVQLPKPVEETPADNPPSGDGDGDEAGGGTVGPGPGGGNNSDRGPAPGWNAPIVIDGSSGGSQGAGAPAGPPAPLVVGGGPAGASATIVAAAAIAAPVPLDAGLNAALGGTGLALSPSLPGLGALSGLPVGDLMGGTGSALAPLLAGSLPEGATLPGGRDPLTAPVPTDIRAMSLPLGDDPAVPVALLVVAVVATGAVAAGHITMLQRGAVPASA